jgi:hypothetical protein
MVVACRQRRLLRITRLHRCMARLAATYPSQCFSHEDLAVSLQRTRCACCRHITGQFPARKSQQLCAFYIERAIEARPEGVETVIGIFDLRGFGLKNADFGFVGFLIEAFFNFYPKRAAEVLMVDAPLAFMGPYELMTPALGKYGNLIKFVSVSQVRQYFSPATLPPDFK